VAKKKASEGRLAPKGARYYEFELGYRVYRDGSVWSQRLRGPGPYRSDLPWRQIAVVPSNKHQQFVTASRTVWSIPALVLEAFVGPRPNHRMMPKHRDGDIYNNAVTNLYWGERTWGSPGTRPGSDALARPLTRQQARRVWRLHSQKGLDASEIAKRLGIKNAGPIQQLLKGLSWNDVTGLPRLDTGRKNAVLNEKLVKEVMRLHTEERLTPREIALKLGLGVQRTMLIKGVVKGKIWSATTGLKPGGV